ncbi:MAG: peptidoglycan DD-metalloendopeptidase family protein [Bacteroidaceae bacterium]|nr:peptidoglycan DD-metalloendopeptidase family protein [Bacteroidaceae bacterium]
MRNRLLGYILTLALLFTVSPSMQAQSDSVEGLRNKANTLRKEIKEKEAILLSSQKDIDSKLSNLKIITAKIDEYKGLVAVLQKEVKALDDKMGIIDKEMKTLAKEIAQKEKSVEISRAEYAEALRKARKYDNFENKMMFVFSTGDFNQMARRYRYTNSYMNAHKELADSLKKKIAELEVKQGELKAKRNELQKARAAKKASLKEQEAERARIQKLEREQKEIIAGLQKEKKKVEAALKKQRNELNKLNAAIKREVEKIVAAENAKKGSAANKNNNNKKSSKGSPKYSEDAGIAKMSGTFQANKGKMPVPITGAYLLVDKFGQRNAVEGKGSVMINNGGLTFKGTKGAKARSIFEGTVSTVFHHNDYTCVLVRHGKYISVYCNVENVRVKSGDTVKAGDIIGDVAIDAGDGNPRLLFQLYSEKTLLDPAGWLKL